ncbi:hypothetical protein [Ascidiimonas aurantiaca]|uniref:hypothetical protein n=1 Tax=Ascidiimonas aurantiaca TaxID=1685432 RepID=UPI0030EC784E
MRIFTIVLLILAVVLIGYNATVVNFNAPFEGDSVIALIGIVASLCAVLLLLIMNVSKKIQQKINNKE